MRGKIALLVFLLWTVWVVPAGAVGNGWQVLTTPHFTFYAQADQVNIMQKLAAIAEEVHPLVVTYVGHEPTEKTHVVIMDISDLPNGMASATFYNQIICFPVHPGNSVAYSSGLGSRTDDWLRTLFIHEYTHILQMDIPSGLAGIIRRCFGHVPGASTPNGLQPLLSIEGLAVHAETLLTEAGRGDDPLYHMFLRTAVLDGKLLRLDQAMNNYYLSRWDPAGAPYLYGASLTEYIARHYGVYALQQVNQMGSSWSNSLYQVLGISLPELWAGWEHEITEKYIEQAEKVQETPLTELVPLGSHGDLTLHPAISPDDSTLAYIATDGVPSGIYLQSMVDGRQRRVVDAIAQTSGNLSWSSDSRLLAYSRINDDSPYRMFTDIYLYDVKKQKERRLTKDQRAFAPCFSPINQQVLFIARVDPLTTQLMTVAVSGGTPEQLKLPLPPELVLLSAEYSPDGTKLAITGWMPGGLTNLYLADLQQGTVKQLTFGRDVEENPVWSPCGKYIYFDSDHGGIYNIHAIDTTTNHRYQVTNVLTGVFAPSVSSTGEIAVMEYTADGYRISSFYSDPSVWLPVANNMPNEQISAGQVLIETTSTAMPANLQPYKPISTLKPTYWLPYFDWTQGTYLLGVTTAGVDVLERTGYSALLAYGLSSKDLSYAVSAVHQFGPNEQWILQASSMAQPWEINEVWHQVNEQELVLAYTWGGLLTQRLLQASYKSNSLSGDDANRDEQLYTAQLYTQKLTGIGLRQRQVLSLIEATYAAKRQNVTLCYRGQERWFTRQNAFTVSTGIAWSQQEGVLMVGGAEAGFNVRGVPASVVGQEAVALSLQYDRITPVEQGYSLLQVFLRDLTVGPFVDAVWATPTNEPTKKVSVGIEVGMNLFLYYRIPISMQAGIAVPVAGSTSRPVLYIDSRLPL